MEKQYTPQSKYEIEFDVLALSERSRFGNQHQQINEVQHNRVGEEPNSVFFTNLSMDYGDLRKVTLSNACTLVHKSPSNQQVEPWLFVQLLSADCLSKSNKII